MNTNRILATIPLAIVSVFLCLGQSCSAPASSLHRFAGTWKLNEAKSSPDAMQKCAFQIGANGGLEMLVEGHVTAIHLDGKRYDTATPGVAQIWEQKGPNTFDQTMLEGKAKVLQFWRFEISHAGKILTVKSNRGTWFFYSRSSGEGSGLVGTWEFQSWHNPNLKPMTISIAGPKSLKIGTRVAVLEAKPFHHITTAPEGSTTAVAAWMMSMKSAWKQIDDHTLVETITRDGVAITTATWELSADNKVMTTTGGGLTFERNGDVTPEANIKVYDRQ